MNPFCSIRIRWLASSLGGNGDALDPERLILGICSQESSDVSVKRTQVFEQAFRRAFAACEPEGLLCLIHLDEVDFGIAAIPPSTHHMRQTKVANTLSTSLFVDGCDEPLKTVSFGFDQSRVSLDNQLFEQSRHLGMNGPQDNQTALHLRCFAERRSISAWSCDVN
jgi:hypothetical protein